MRQDLSRICDADLTASLPLVSAATTDQGDDPNRTLPPPSVGDSTSAGTRFRILRPHAKGGLGEVYLARDNELNRDVALKEIQDRFADDPRHRSRFEYPNKLGLTDPPEIRYSWVAWEFDRHFATKFSQKLPHGNIEHGGSHADEDPSRRI